MNPVIGSRVDAESIIAVTLYSHTYPSHEKAAAAPPTERRILN